MSRTQDKFERILKEIHVLFAESPASPVDQDMIVVDKNKVFSLLNKLNVYVYQLLDEHEVTDAAKDRVKREAIRRGDKLIAEAEKKAEDVYAASMMYTANALSAIQKAIDDANKASSDALNTLSKSLDKQKKTIKKNQQELNEQLQHMADAKLYLRLLDEKRYEMEKQQKALQREVEKAESTEKEEAEAKEKAVASDKPEIKINMDYFERTGMAVPNADDDKDEEIPKEAAEITVNLDAEYFKWKQEQSEK